MVQSDNLENCCAQKRQGKKTAGTAGSIRKISHQRDYVLAEEGGRKRISEENVKERTKCGKILELRDRELCKGLGGTVGAVVIVIGRPR